MPWPVFISCHVDVVHLWKVHMTQNCQVFKNPLHVGGLTWDVSLYTMIHGAPAVVGDVSSKVAREHCV